MKRITASDVLQPAKRAFLWSDRVLWGEPLGRLVILAVLLAGGGPVALEVAVAKADAINRALDAVTADPVVAEPVP